MTPIEFFLIWSVASLCAATAIGCLIKGRPWSGFLLGFFLGWIGVVIIAVMPPAHAELVQRERKRLQIQEEARRAPAALGFQEET